MPRRIAQVIVAWLAMLQVIMICTTRTGSSAKWNNIAPQIAENANPAMLDARAPTPIAAITAMPFAPACPARPRHSKLVATRAAHRAMSAFFASIVASVRSWGHYTICTKSYANPKSVSPRLWVHNAYPAGRPAGRNRVSPVTSRHLNIQRSVDRCVPPGMGRHDLVSVVMGLLRVT